MARQRGTSRVTEAGSAASPTRSSSPEFPSFRKRRPLMFWAIIIATFAMILPLVAGIITSFA